MGKLFLLYLTFVVGMLFVVFPDMSAKYDFFLFYDIKLSVANYVYFIWEKVIMIILALIIAKESTKYKGAVWIFFWLLCADLVDFLLSYGAIWYDLNGFPISMNTVKVIVFGIVILKEWTKEQFQQQ